MSDEDRVRRARKAERPATVSAFTLPSIFLSMQG